MKKQYIQPQSGIYELNIKNSLLLTLSGDTLVDDPNKIKSSQINATTGQTQMGSGLFSNKSPWE